MHTYITLVTCIMCIAYIKCITYIACMHAHVRKYVHALRCIAFHCVTAHIVHYIFLHYITLRILIHPSRMNTYIHMTINITLHCRTLRTYHKPLWPVRRSTFCQITKPTQWFISNAYPAKPKNLRPERFSQKKFPLFKAFLCFPWIVEVSSGLI